MVAEEGVAAAAVTPMNPPTKPPAVAAAEAAVAADTNLPAKQPAVVEAAVAAVAVTIKKFGTKKPPQKGGFFIVNKSLV